MTPRTLLAWSVPVALVAVHCAPWRPAGTLGATWLPAELAFRLAWTAVATLYLLWFCARVWRLEDGDGDRDGGPRP